MVRRREFYLHNSMSRISFIRPSLPSETPNYHKQNIVWEGFDSDDLREKQGKGFRFLFAASPHFDIWRIYIGLEASTRNIQQCSLSRHSILEQLLCQEHEQQRSCWGNKPHPPHVPEGSISHLLTNWGLLGLSRRLSTNKPQHRWETFSCPQHFPPSYLTYPFTSDHRKGLIHWRPAVTSPSALPTKPLT